MAKASLKRRGTCWAYPMALAGGLTAAAVFAPVASATGYGTLSADQCTGLKSERQSLEAAGVAGHLQQGATWARDNLSPVQIAQVARLIALDEQLKFKCPVGFDNAVVAAIRGTESARVPPPLPVRPPAEVIAERKLAALRPTVEPQGEAGVPLPSRNAARREVPAVNSPKDAAPELPSRAATGASNVPPLPRRAKP